MAKIDNSDIENLNSNITHSEDELASVRKKFLIMLFVFLLIIIIFFLYFILRDDIRALFSSNEQEVEEETIEEVELSQYEDGEIAVDDEKIQELYQIFRIYYYDYYVVDSLSVYNKSLNEMSSSEILYFISKTNDFKTIIKGENKYMNYSLLCENEIEISKGTVENIAKNRFNLDSVEHSSFWTTYIYNGAFVSYLYFEYKDDIYTGSCKELDEESISVDTISYNNLYKAEKEGDKLYLYMNVFFENEKGVYSDINLKNRITDEYNYDNIDDYYSNGSIYKIEFILGDDGYYFNKISYVE